MLTQLNLKEIPQRSIYNLYVSWIRIRCRFTYSSSSSSGKKIETLFKMSSIQNWKSQQIFFTMCLSVFLLCATMNLCSEIGASSLQNLCTSRKEDSPQRHQKREEEKKSELRNGHQTKIFFRARVLFFLLFAEEFQIMWF